MHTPENITNLKTAQVFVFGSNEAGRHGRGAAKHAVTHFDAVYGVGFGFGKRKQTFAIPTKDRQVRTLPLRRIREYVSKFLEISRDCPELTFLVTKLGCGLAGYSPTDIAPMFIGAPENVILPIEFNVIINSISNSPQSTDLII